MSKRDFTLILPYYENPGQLQKQYAELAALPADVRSHVHLIVCDDGSPDHPAVIYDWLQVGGLFLASFQLFRVDVDVRWNWIACRNIGAHHAKTEWLLLTDIDHLLPEATARRIIDRKLRPDHVYRFSRKNYPALDDYKPHPNSWLMTKAMYDKIGGYDERFSGYYGTDGMFRDRVHANAKRTIMLPECLLRVSRETIPDASTTRYLRKQPEDHEGVSRIRREVDASGGGTVRLSFPYHRVFP